MLIPRLIDSVRNGKPVQLHGENGLSINPAYVGDAVAAVRRAMVIEGSHKLNVAGPEALSLRTIADIIGEEVGRPPVFEVNPSDDNRDLLGDTERMRSALHVPEVRFRDGLRLLLSEMS